MRLLLNRVLERSVANGPGERFVVWVQGCGLACPGCFNAETWGLSGGYETTSRALAERINGARGLRGVTLSGGEPLDQPEAVADLLDRLDPALDRVLFTGYRFEEAEGDPRRAAVLRRVDLAVAGRFVRSLVSGAGSWSGSSNKEVRVLTGRVPRSDVPQARIEAHVGVDGTLLVTGFPPAGLLAALGGGDPI